MSLANLPEGLGLFRPVDLNLAVVSQAIAQVHNYQVNNYRLTES